MKRVRTITEDGINLIGINYISKENNTEWCLIFPGVDGNIITNDFIDKLGNFITTKGYNFLCSHTRGAFQIISSNSASENETGKTIGSAFENFDDCIYDINAWIDYAIQNGAENINIICHSHGCNKIIYYLSQDKSRYSYINKVIFLSPLDLITRMNKRREVINLIETATKTIKENKYPELINCGFFYKSSSSFLDMMTNKNVDNFPFMSEDNKPFSMFNSIEKDKFIIYGESEKKYLDKFNDKMKMIDKNFLKGFYIINQANHIYQEKEDVLCNYVISILTNNIENLENLLEGNYEF